MIFYHTKKSQNIKIIFWDELSDPRYHPFWTLCTCINIPLCGLNAPPVRADLIKCRHVSMSVYCFDQPAPECSHDLLSQTALSVGDAVFLSMSADVSLLHCIYSCPETGNLWMSLNSFLLCVTVQYPHSYDAKSMRIGFADGILHSWITFLRPQQ